MRSTRLYDSDSGSIIIRVHQPLQPLTHQPIIENTMAFVRQRLLLLSCYVRTKEPLTSIIVHASDYLLPTNVVSSLRSLWIIPLLCMNFKALAMPFAHPITFFFSSGRSCCRETTYVVLISENVLHQVLPAEFDDKDWSRLTLLPQKCCAVHLNNKGMIQLPKKGTIGNLALKQFFDGRPSFGSSLSLHMIPVKTLYAN